jgi:hypothetical protein
VDTSLDHDVDAISGPATPISGPATPLPAANAVHCPPTLDDLLGITNKELHKARVVGNLLVSNALSKAKTKDLARGIPISIKQALNCVDSARWSAAIRRELQSLKDLGVFLELRSLDEIYAHLGPDAAKANIVHMDFTWAFKIKLDQTYRARIALRGFKSGPLPLNETSSPTASVETFRIILALSVASIDRTSNMKLRELSFDVDHAFMRSRFDLSKRMYVCPVPPLYPLDDPETLFLLCLKSLYGGKEASMMWYLEVKSIAIGKLGFTRSPVDACLFYKRTETSFIIFIIHVDDGRITAFMDSDEEWNAFKLALEQAFDGGLKFLDGSMHTGMNVIRNKNGVKISLETYLTSTFKEIDPDNIIPIRDTPYIHIDMEKLMFSDTSPRLNFKQTKHFQNLLGICNYVRTRTRPDIEYPMAIISMKTSTPTRFAMDSVLHVMGYLKNTISLGITYTKGELALLAHSDASLNPLPGGRQFGGNFVSIAGGATCWNTKRQTIATDNTADAELLQAWSLARKVEGIIELFESLQIRIPLPVPIGQDNGATMLAMTTLTSRKSRHLALKLGVIQDLVMERFLIKPLHIHSEDNLADGMTKAYLPKIFKYYRDLWLNIDQKNRFVPRLHPPHTK